MFVFFVNLLAMPRDPAKFEIDLGNKFVVFLCGDFFAARLNVDKSPDQARFCIRDADCLVRAKEYKAFELIRILSMSASLSRKCWRSVSYRSS